MLRWSHSRWNGEGRRKTRLKFSGTTRSLVGVEPKKKLTPFIPRSVKPGCQRAALVWLPTHYSMTQHERWATRPDAGRWHSPVIPL